MNYKGQSLAIGDKSVFVNVVSRWMAKLTGQSRLGGRERLRQDLEQLRKELEQLRSDIRQGQKDLQGELQRLHEFVQTANAGSYRNVQLEMQRIALSDSAALARGQMIKAQTFGHPHQTLEHALSLAPRRGGLALEFGVFSGTTLRIIAAVRKDGRVYGFDSFQGLPETWRTGFPAGAFAARIPEVEGAKMVVGWFNETLPQFLQEHPGVVDFVHVDCDLYSSTKTVLDLVGPRLRPGSMLLFDEFFNYPGWQDHEFKAWSEYVARTGTRFEYEAYTLNNEQVAVRIVE